MRKLYLLAIFQVVSSFTACLYSQMLAAELTANVEQPGKFTIHLQVIYTMAESNIPASEIVSFSSVNGQEKKLLLKKNDETTKISTSVAGDKVDPLKSVSYSTIVEQEKGEFDLLWSTGRFKKVLNNIQLEKDERVVITIHVDEVQVVNHNRISILDLLPLTNVKSDQVVSIQIPLTGLNEKMLDIRLTAPEYSEGEMEQTKQNSNMTSASKQAVYREGFSAEKPAGEAFVYNAENRQMTFDHLPFGAYLFAVSVRDYRNNNRLPLQKAVFLIDSLH